MIVEYKNSNNKYWWLRNINISNEEFERVINGASLESDVAFISFPEVKVSIEFIEIKTELGNHYKVINNKLEKQE